MSEKDYLEKNVWLFLYNDLKLLLDEECTDPYMYSRAFDQVCNLIRNKYKVYPATGKQSE